jgi:hypothetical protein
MMVSQKIHELTTRRHHINKINSVSASVERFLQNRQRLNPHWKRLSARLRVYEKVATGSGSFGDRLLAVGPKQTTVMIAAGR